jgi:hypothetical protein
MICNTIICNIVQYLYLTICHYVKKLQIQACRLRSHTVDVTPPQAATKIMAGMAEQQTEWRNRMADRMVE